MAPITKEKGTLVTGVIGNDVHISGIRILEYALQKAGFKIVSLGAMTPAEDFINAAIETKANVILVSSLNGHAKICCEGFRDKCIEAGLSNIILYVGGMLVVGEDRFSMKWEDVEKMFKDMGFDRVYPPGVMPGTVIEDLEQDLSKVGGKS
jgi:methylaspartate mutase sigma subunit